MSIFTFNFLNKKKEPITSISEVDPNNLGQEEIVFIMNHCLGLVDSNPNDSDLGKEIRKTFNALRYQD